MIRQPLPIDAHLAGIVQTLESHNCLIVEAPPGTGKTTRVAPALIDAVKAPRGQLVLIQPRRIAARAAAARIAFEMGCRVGERVGYQVRFDARMGPTTRLLCMTPGILLRRLHSDAVLERISTVILDEFHERSLEVDLLLGMLRRLQVALRPELRIVIMSATLDSSRLQATLEQPPLIRVDAQAYPVTIRHSRFQSSPRGQRVSQTRRIVEQATATTIAAAAAQAGDILVFLPGVGEIMQVARNLEPEAAKHGWELLRLFGDMPPGDQDRVLAACDRRKVILSTNVAETSLTIDGVKIVVDSGWARVARVDVNLGLNMLKLEPISQASAKQRAGRAGRTSSGMCYRLWDEVTDRSRPPHLEPEILRVDLAGAALQLLAWGEPPLGDFPWVTPPRQQAMEQALSVLELLDATCQGKITPTGQSMLQLPVQPRIARFLIAAHRLGVPRAASLAAAILSERDVFERHAASRQPGTSHGQGITTSQPPQPQACDLTQRVIALQHFLQTGNAHTPQGTIKPAAARAASRAAEQFANLVASELGASTEADLDAQLQQALLVAFPDRLARRRSAGSPRGVMVGGRGVKLDAKSSVQQADLFLCLDVDAGASEALVRQASTIEVAWLPLEHLREVDERFFNPTLGAIVARRRLYWLDLMISETPIATPADEETAHMLAQAAVQHFPKLLPANDKELSSWLARVAWLSQAIPDSGLPSLAPEQLAELVRGWCYGMKSLDELKSLPWKRLLQGLLDANARKRLDSGAPQTVTLPSGRQVLLQYEVGKPPVLAARIQEFFGLAQTPRLAGGRIPLLLHLLAPNNRCQQITDDLASFWKNTYPIVRKELRGRYPKHAWPENPQLPHAGQ